MRLLYRLILYLEFLIIVLGCNTKDNDSTNENLQIDIINSKRKLGNNKSLSNNERKTYLRKANNLIRELPDNLIKIRQIHRLSVDYYVLKDFKKYKSLNIEAIKLSKLLKDSSMIAKSYSNLGIYFGISEQPDISYENFYEAKKIYDAFEKDSGKNLKTFAYDYGKVLLDLARIKRKSKDFVESESLTIRATELFNLSGNKKYLSLCYTNLGIIAKYLERYDAAVNYHNKAIESDRGSEGEIEQTLISLNNIGTTYKSQKKYRLAKKFYKEALNYKDFLNGDARRYALLIDNLAYVKFLSQDLEDIPELFYKALKIRDSIGDKNGLATNYLHLSEYYQSLKNYSFSRDYANKSKKIAKELGNNDELLKLYRILSKVSDGKEGLKYARAYIKLNDSLVKEERLFRDKLARIQFETEEKEKKITEVQNQNTIYLLGILVSLMGIGFIIYFFKQRTKYMAQQNQIEKFQASYETETRISKRLHDEIGNDIFQLMLQYENDPHDPIIKEKLNTSYIKARDISRENNEFETGETFSEELYNMLQNYTQNGIQLMVRGFDTIDWTYDKSVKITLYRVLQELMTNMQKHSNATLVVFVFSNLDKILKIKYSDNGVGIAQDTLISKNGLRNTEKRIRAIGGTLIFDSENGKGFKAEIKIPNLKS